MFIRVIGIFKYKYSTETYCSTKYVKHFVTASEKKLYSLKLIASFLDMSKFSEATTGSGKYEKKRYNIEL